MKNNVEEELKLKRIKEVRGEIKDTSFKEDES